MALPKEPRQKMINIMYLVLTALLALNVSAEILNAFKIVDNSLTSTNRVINASTDQIMASLQKKANEVSTRDRAKPWLDKANQVKKLTADAYQYVDGVKSLLMKQADYDPAKNGNESFNLEAREMVTRTLIEEGKGMEIYNHLKQYRDNLLKLDPDISAEFSKSLQINLDTPPVEDKSNDRWDLAYFHMVPNIAALTMLSKFQNDIKTSENKVIAFCHRKVGEVEIVFDQYKPIVGQSSSYIMPGQDIEISAGVGSFSSKSPPTVTIGGSNAPVADGMGTLKLSGGGVGSHSVPVRISFFNQNTGKQESIEKTIEYTVGQANASIGLDKMNVLYIGVDNPVTIAASGGGDDKVQANISGGGSLVRTPGAGAGKYTARVSTQSDDCMITVLVDGKVSGEQKFRVRNIPPANAFVGNYISGSSVPAAAFKAQPGVAAGIQNFPFELSYQVASFTITCDNDEGDVDTAPCQGNLWSPQAKSMLNKNVKAGRTVTVDDIKIKGPDGRVTASAGGSLVYYIK